MSEHHAHHRLTRGAERHADADLTTAFGDHVRQDPVGADHREQQRERGKNRQQLGEQPRPANRFLEDFVHRAKADDRKRRVQRAHGPLDRARKGFGRQRRPDHHVHRLGRVSDGVEVQLASRLLIDSALLDVADNARDGEPGSGRIAARAHPAPDRAPARPEHPCHGLIHQDGGRARGVGLAETLTVHDRNPHRVEVIRCHLLVVVHRRHVSRCLRQPLDEGAVGVHQPQRRQADHRGDLEDAGRRAQVVQQPPVVGQPIGGCRIPRNRKAHAKRDQARAIESRIDPREVGDGAQQQSRADDQRDSQGDLADDQAAAQRMTSSGGALAAFFERGPRALGPQVEKRRDAEDDAGQQGHAEGEREDRPVDRDVARAGEAVGKCRDECADAGDRDAETEGAAGDGQQASFGDRLAQQPSPRGADGGADCELLAARFGARQQQRRKVRARDQKNQHDRSLEDPERRRRRADHVSLQRVDAQAMGRRSGRMHEPVGRARCLRGSHSERSGPPLRQQGLELSPRAVDRHAVGEPANQVGEMAAAIRSGVERQRQPDLAALIRDVECRRHDADHGPADAVDLDEPAHESRVGAKRRSPYAIRQHDDGRRAGPRVRRLERAAELRNRTERLEEIVRCRHHPHPLRPIGRREIRFARGVHAHRRERAGPLAKLEEFRDGDPELVPSRKGAGDPHQSIRLLVLERLENHGVQHREDRGVGADTEREGQDGGRGEAWRLPQHPQRVAKVLHGGLHERQTLPGSVSFRGGRDPAEFD